MPKLGYFLKNDMVGIGLAEKYSLAANAAAAAAFALETGHTVMLEHQWASGFAEKYMVYRPE